MKELEPVNALPVFKELQYELITLLKSLNQEEWYYPTSSSRWNVKQVVSHLLDGDIRRLSLHRDKLQPPEPGNPVDDYRSLVSFLNELNELWIQATERISPRLLVELTEFTTPRVIEHMESLDPEGIALFSVAWAGEQRSQNWFDIAREYTEKWHHQQQIREAIEKPQLLGRKWVYPLIDTLIRAVPAVYNREVQIADTTNIKISVSGVIDDSWLLSNAEGIWGLYKSDSEHTVTEVRMDDDTAWRLFTKNISEKDALKRLEITGEIELGEPVAKTTSFMK